MGRCLAAFIIASVVCYATHPLPSQLAINLFFACCLLLRAAHKSKEKIFNHFTEGMGRFCPALVLGSHSGLLEAVVVGFEFVRVPIV